MMAALHGLARDYRLLWRMVLSARHRHVHLYVLCLTALATLIMALLVYGKGRDPLLALGASACMALGGMVTGWTVAFLYDVVSLNTPANARLVPRMRRRLIGLTATVWATATGALTLLAAGTPLSVPAVFLITGTLLATLGLARSSHWLGVSAQFLVFPLIALRDTVFGTVLGQLTHGAGFALATVLLLALGVFTLRTMFMNGGERHYAMRQAQRLQTERLSPEGQFRQGKSNKFATRIYVAALRRDCRGHDAGKLLGHLFGARDHWTYQLMALGGSALLTGAVLLALRTYGGETLRDMLANGGWVFALGVLLVPLFEHERSNIRLRDTRGEQALLRLAPRMPAEAQVFNRRLSGILLRNAVVGWCLQVAAVMWLTFAVGASVSFFAVQACLCCLTLPLLGTNLRDHARYDKVLGLGPVLALLVSAGISFAIGGVASKLFGTPVLPVAALTSVLITLIVLPWRWKQGVEAPHAFPVGRLA